MFTVNLVVPEADAVSRSPPPVPLIASTALFPIELFTKSGNSVPIDVAPTRTWESKSPVRIMFPVPLGVSERVALDVVPRVALDPAPRLRVVDDIPRVAAEVIVARLPAVMVARPAAESTVSSAAKVNVLLPESRVRPLVVVDIVAALPFPRFKVVAVIPRVAADVIVASDEAVREVVPLHVCPTALTVSLDPAAPLRGDIITFPVVSPPMVND